MHHYRLLMSHHDADGLHKRHTDIAAPRGQNTAFGQGAALATEATADDNADDNSKDCARARNRQRCRNNR